MSEHESLNATTGSDWIHPFRRSLMAARCVFALCVLLSGFSALAFLFQVLYGDDYGELFRDQPHAWLHLFGHLLRSGVGAVLSWCLWRYLRTAKKSINADQCGTPEFFQALARWWNYLAISSLALVLYGGWVAFVTGPPVVTHPLSPRFQAEPPDKSSVKVEFRLAELSGEKGLIEATVAGSPETVFLHSETLLTNQDIADARVVLNERGKPAVEVRFVPSAQQRMRAATEAHRGKPLAILIDGRLVSAPVVRWQIGESARIQGVFSREEAERIARGLSGRK